MKSLSRALTLTLGSMVCALFELFPAGFTGSCDLGEQVSGSSLPGRQLEQYLPRIVGTPKNSWGMGLSSLLALDLRFLRVTQMCVLQHSLQPWQRGHLSHRGKKRKREVAGGRGGQEGRAREGDRRGGSRGGKEGRQNFPEE